MKDDVHKIIGKTRLGALYFMFDQIKVIALRRKSTLISAINAKNMLADAENTTHYIRRYCGE